MKLLNLGPRDTKHSFVDLDRPLCISYILFFTFLTYFFFKVIFPRYLPCNSLFSLQSGILSDAFGTPRGHPKSKPFVDRVMSFFAVKDSICKLIDQFH